MKLQVSSVGIAALIERASRLIHSIGYSDGLYPAQWVALRYFTNAAPSSRTTAALARFQGMSLGPVARTVRTLVDKGLLARAANPLSRRADLLAVTTAGHCVLKNDPRGSIAAAIEAMPLEHRESLALAMEMLIPSLLTVPHSPDHHDADHDSAEDCRAPEHGDLPVS